MRFIEMTGQQLTHILSDDEMQLANLKAAGVGDQTIVRINEQGDIEIRRHDQWDVIGGLLGNYEERVTTATGLTWA